MLPLLHSPQNTWGGVITNSLSGGYRCLSILTTLLLLIHSFYCSFLWLFIVKSKLSVLSLWLVYLTRKKTSSLVFFTLLAFPPLCLSPLDFNLQGRVLGGALTIGCLLGYNARRRARYRADRFGQARGEHLC